MKKVVSCILSVFLLALTLAAPAQAAVTVEDNGYDWERFQGQDITLNVYNWGLYISDGSDGGMDINKEFEELTGIKVNYTTYDTNESMYAKIKSGGADYDVVVPSDYMIGKMIKEGLLAELDFSNIPNMSLIGSQYKGRDYDPNDAYCVPYTWGVVGLIYNTTMVNGEIDSWDALWDPAYKGNVLMFNNSRDAFAIASKKLGLSLNPSSAEEIQQAAEELKKQKSVVQAYVMDEIFDKMEGGEAALAPYYAGDAIIMMDENPDLAFAIPKEGTNYFVDAMCVPATSTHKEAAEMYINFMCETEVALANCEFIGYSTPQVEAEALLPDELKNSPIMYPSQEVLANTETFNVLPDELNKAMDEAWSNVKSYDEGGSAWLIPTLLAVAVGLIVIILWRKSVKKKRNDY
ncbi:spermidine/putrescine ABC transporter substrate-binding protein [Anaerofilum sp. BX8]|uniref:Spermidine/putrescine ABC transporter substrate-binding protein n=1 Tax=Anaerofilum hominis TaxID=2763016 RepID=A0A923KUP0_9FIRM|nr:spermidine/putrescine ABC transporter substrate-binding protein [Anaerofilum hominis]MBC5579906.1 spermidine/putrescine ABC transporter substrate-binding protein [Anaerofilum hominis]